MESQKHARALPTGLGRVARHRTHFGTGIRTRRSGGRIRIRFIIIPPIKSLSWGLSKVVATGTSSRATTIRPTSRCASTTIHITARVESFSKSENATTTIDEEKNAIIGNDLGGDIKESGDKLESVGGGLSGQRDGVERNRHEIEKP